MLESVWITEGSVGQNKSIAVAEEKNNKISSDFSTSLSVHENPVHLGRGMEFWTGRSCKAQKRSVSEAEIETENNLWLQKQMDILLQLSVRRVT